MDSNRYLTGQKLSQLLNVSSKTIRNEIKILNQLMNNFALIQSIPSHGYQISIFDDDLFNCWIDKVSKQWSYFIPTNPLERAYYILGLMLESQEFIKIDDISDILFIDRTPVSRSLKYIRERLNDFDLKIVQKTGKRRKRNIAKKRVLLINEYNVAMSELLSFSILKRYKDSLVIEKTISAGELSKYHLESYDYIITTVPLDESLDIPVIRIHPIITTHDFEVLNKYFRQINEYKLSDFLKKEDTYFIDCETKDDVISYIFEHESVSFETFYHTNPLIGFETSLQTVIHYMPIYNQKSSINAYLLSKPIVWKNKLVKIIFVLKLGIDSEQLLQSLQEFFFQKECMDTFLNNMILEEGDEHNKS